MNLPCAAASSFRLTSYVDKLIDIKTQENFQACVDNKESVENASHTQR